MNVLLLRGKIERDIKTHAETHRKRCPDAESDMHIKTQIQSCTQRVTHIDADTQRERERHTHTHTYTHTQTHTPTHTQSHTHTHTHIQIDRKNIFYYYSVYIIYRKCQKVHVHVCNYIIYV